MLLAKFLNNLFKKEGFELIDANSKKHVIGNPKEEKPLILKLLINPYIINSYFILIFILVKPIQREL
jgi:hypothetical protein